MDSFKLAVKFFVRDASALTPETIVHAFHALIQGHALADHLLIDVADYAHVVNGPGTVLVSHEANIHLDHAEGRTGLLYVRKQPIAGAVTFAERLRAVLRATLSAAGALEQLPALRGKFSIRTDEFRLRINDRLAAPNSAETFAAIRGDLESVATGLYGGPVELASTPTPGRLFEATVKGSETSTSALLQRLTVSVARPI